MEIAEEYRNLGDISSSGSLITFLRKLIAADREMTYSVNARIEGRSGLRHRFDFLIRSSDGTGEATVGMIIGKDIKDRMAKISSFYASSTDVSASRAILILDYDPSMEEKMLITALGLEISVIGESPGLIIPEIESSQGASKLKSHGSRELPVQSKKPSRTRKKYRDRTQIIHEILTSTSNFGGATITRIIFKCNLNYKTAKEILSDMIRKELLVVNNDDENKKVYRTTKVGRSLLEKLYYYESVNGHIN